jgi:hypothetical protein
VTPAGLEPAAYGLGRPGEEPHPREPTRIDGAERPIATAPTRIVAASGGAALGGAEEFRDVILVELLRAQAGWLSSGDVTVLRRELLRVLTRLE